MPIYEFRCDSCGRRFEALVGAGTESVACRACGSPATVRVLSAQAASPRLVKSTGERRGQERRNERLRARARADFKAARRRARKPGGGGE